MHSTDGISREQNVLMRVIAAQEKEVSEEAGWQNERCVLRGGWAGLSAMDSLGLCEGAYDYTISFLLRPAGRPQRSIRNCLRP